MRARLYLQRVYVWLPCLRTFTLYAYAPLQRLQPSPLLVPLDTSRVSSNAGGSLNYSIGWFCDSPSPQPWFDYFLPDSQPCDFDCIPSAARYNLLYACLPSLLVSPSILPHYLPLAYAGFPTFLPPIYLPYLRVG